MPEIPESFALTAVTLRRLQAGLVLAAIPETPESFALIAVSLILLKLNGHVPAAKPGIPESSALNAARKELNIKEKREVEPLVRRKEKGWLNGYKRI
jgi:hypothetical protein